MARVEDTLVALAESHPSQLVKYGAELALRRLNNEWDDASLSPIQFNRDPSASRLPTRNTEDRFAESEYWASFLSFEGEPHLISGLYGQLASDAVAVYDHSGSPKGIGRLPTNIRARDKGISFARLNTIYGEVSSARNLRTEELISLVNDTERMISLAGREGDVRFAREGVVGEISRALPKLRELRELSARGEDDYRTYILAYRELADSLTPERLSAGHEELKQGLSKLYDAEMVGRPVVDVQGLHEVATDQDLNPFLLPDKRHDRLLFQMLHNVELRDAVEVDLGIAFNDIPLREQTSFLRYLAGQDQAGFYRLRGALQKHPESANEMLRCFLANAEDVHYADRILDIAESLEPSEAGRVFDKYLEITEAADSVRNLIASESEVSVTEAQLADATRNLLHRANEILADTAERATDSSVDLNNVVQRLDRAHGDLLLQRTFLNEVAGRELANRQSALATRVETLVGGEIGARDRYLLGEIAQENTAKMYADSPSVRDFARESFQIALQNPNSRIVVSRSEEGQPLSFLVLTNKSGAESAELYLGSYNTDPFYQSLEFGNELFTSTIEQYGATNPIRLFAYARNQAGIDFYRRHGFQIVDSTASQNSDSDLIEMHRPAGVIN